MSRREPLAVTLYRMESKQDSTIKEVKELKGELNSHVRDHKRIGRREALLGIGCAVIGTLPYTIFHFVG